MSTFYSEPRYGYDYTIAKIGNTEFAFPSYDASLAPFQSSGYDLLVNSILTQANVPNTISIYTKAGIHNQVTTSGATIPFGMSVYFYGDGIPSYPYPVAPSTYATPSDGTQIRGFSGLLTTTSPTASMFNRASGANAKGVTSFRDMAIMPPWGATSTASGALYGVYDQYASIYYEDNLMFVPWGWSEAGSPAPNGPGGSGTNTIIAQDLDAGGIGGGTQIRIGNLIMFGMGQGGQLHGADNVQIDEVVMYRVDYGIGVGGIWKNRINALEAYDGNHYRLSFFTTRRGNHVGDVKIEQIGVTPASSFLFMINSGIFATVEYVYFWQGTNARQSGIATILSSDSQLERPCAVFNQVGVAGGSGVIRYAGGSPSFPVQTQSGTVLMLLETGTGGSGAVLKMWDPGAGAFRYAQISGGAWSITTTEPS